MTILLGYIQETVFTVVILVVVYRLADQLTLRYALCPRLFLTIQKSLLIEISFFCMISDRIAANQLACLLITRENLSL